MLKMSILQKASMLRCSLLLLSLDLRSGEYCHQASGCVDIVSTDSVPFNTINIHWQRTRCDQVVGEESFLISLARPKLDCAFPPQLIPLSVVVLASRCYIPVFIFHSYISKVTNLAVKNLQYPIRKFVEFMVNIQAARWLLRACHRNQKERMDCQSN